MKDHIQFGSVRIYFTIQICERKSLGITVTPEMDVIVKVPENTSLEKVKTILRKKAPWILRQQNFFLGFHPRTPARRYISGESHFFLGRQYRLKVKEGKKPEVRYKGKELEIVFDKKSKPEKLLKAWYRSKAKEKFSEIAEPLIQKFQKYKVAPTKLYLLDMKYRWGSCTSKGRIILNPELIKAPKRCIEYVIIHELCHLKHHNHTRKFYELQTQVMPDWEKWKDRLEKMMV